MRLRKAQTDDAPLLMRWDGNPHIKGHLGDFRHDWPLELARDPAWRELLIAESGDGRPVGFIQIIDPALEEDHYWGEVESGVRAIDIWIGEESDLGRGLGSEMMRLAIGRCFRGPDVTAILVDPLADNAASIRFYARLGFRAMGRRRFGPDECMVMRLDRDEAAAR